MPQGVRLRKIGHSSIERRSIFMNLMTDLVKYGRVVTTVPKAKTIAPMMDDLITAAKKGTPNGYKRMRARLFERDETVPAMMTTLRDRYLNRPGGYTRIIPSGNRPGDNAPTAILELVDSEGEFKLELAARELGRKVFEEELSTGLELPIMYDKLLNEYRNFFLRQKIEQVLKFKPPEARTMFIQKADAYRELLRSESPVFGGMARPDTGKFENEPLRQIFKNPKHTVTKQATTELNASQPMTGRIHRVGELMPAMAVRTPRKPVAYEDRHEWSRLPPQYGGRGGFVDTWLIGPDGKPDKTGKPLSTVGAGLGQSERVGGVDGVPEHEGWQNGGNGEFSLGRKPMDIAKGALGRKRVPVPRLTRGGDGMGG